MQESIVKESPRRRIGRRVAAAGMALAAAVTLAGCHEARGGGYIGAAARESASPIVQWQSKLRLHLRLRRQQGQGPDHVPRHQHEGLARWRGLFPGLRLHGTVENVLIDADMPLDNIPPVPATTCQEVIEADWAQFQGSYRSQETTLLSKPPGKFTVVVFDQGEPGRTRGPFDHRGRLLHRSRRSGPYAGYTRAGYIEGGNIQVE